MAVVVIRADGTGDYTTATAACASGLVNPGDILDYTEAGTYTEQLTGLSALPSNVAVQNTSGGVVTVADIAGRASYAIDLTGANAFSDVTLSATSSGGGRFFDARGAQPFLTRCILAVRDTPAGGIYYWFHSDATSVITTAYLTTSGGTRWRLIDETGSAGSRWADDRSLFGIGSTAALGLFMAGTGSTAVFLGTRISSGSAALVRSGGTGTFAYSNCRAISSGPLFIKENAAAGATVTFDACGGAAGGLVSQTLGTITSLTIRGSYATNLVVKTGGAITVFTGDHNCYVTTAAGTSSATDKVVTAYADFKLLGGPTGLEPREDSALLDVIPADISYGSSDTDLLGNPRLTGGRQTCGPVQAQLFPDPIWKRELLNTVDH